MSHKLITLPHTHTQTQMCVSRCLHCVGLSLIPMAIVCMLCNILLLVPDLKIHFLLEKHVTREATWATGLWGSGFVVRLCVSMNEGCFGFVLFCFLQHCFMKCQKRGPLNIWSVNDVFVPLCRFYFQPERLCRAARPKAAAPSEGRWAEYIFLKCQWFSSV